MMDLKWHKDIMLDLWGEWASKAREAEQKISVLSSTLMVRNEH